MVRRQRVKTRFIALLMLLAFGLSVSTHFISGSLVLAQDAVDSSVKRTISYLVENTKDFLVNFELDRTFTIDNNTGRRYASNFKEQPFDLKDLGKLIFRAQSDVDLPQKIGLTGNRAAGDVFFSLQHQLEGVNIPPHIQLKLRGEASDSGFMTQQGKLASIELTFEGLLLKGVPEYLSKTDLMKQLIRENGFKLEPQGDSKAILTKTISLSSQQQDLFNMLSSIEERLSEKQQQIQQISSLDNARSPLRVAQIEDLKNDLRKYTIEKSDLLSQVFRNLEFPCAPEFKREIKFPIFERSASSSSSNASARAALGVSGNVEMEVRNPTCGISMISPFKFEAWTYADIDITSRGFFGARAEAEASGDVGITFSDKSGPYPISLEISAEEKQAFNGLALKMFDKAKNNQQILRSLQQQIDSQAVQISTSIQKELIGDDTDIPRICSLFDKLGLRTPNSEEDLICWAFNTASLPPKPELPNIPLNLLPKPNLPKRPEVECKADVRLPSCPTKKVSVCRPAFCSRRRCVPGTDICKTVEEPCTTCSEQTIVEPTCQSTRRTIEATNALNRTACSRIQSWDTEVKRIEGIWNADNQKIQEQWTRDVGSARQEFNRKLTAWTEQAERWNKYRNPVLVLAVANRAVTERVLRPVESRTVAQNLLDAAWQGVDWVNMTNDFVRTNLPGDLSIDIRGSARAAITSRAHLLHARPKFKTSSTLDISPEGQPSLNLVFSGFQNAREDGIGGIGGLDVLGYTLTAEQTVSVGGKKIQQPKYEIPPESFTPTFDEGKILLSNKEEIIYQGSYRYGSGTLVSDK